MAHSKEKKINSTEFVPKKDNGRYITQRHKTTALKLLRELKEDVEKVMKTMCEQNGNVNKEIALKKKKNGARKYKIERKNSLEGFSGRFEQGKESANLKIRTIEIIKPEEQKVKKVEEKKIYPKGPL